VNMSVCRTEQEKAAKHHAGSTVRSGTEIQSHAHKLTQLHLSDHEALLCPKPFLAVAKCDRLSHRSRASPTICTLLGCLTL
jgi:hypothetical protein